MKTDLLLTIMNATIGFGLFGVIWELRRIRQLMGDRLEFFDVFWKSRKDGQNAS